MLDSTVSVLNYYIDIPYYHINSIDAFRVDIEDTVYLVETEEGAVAIYETDYFISLDAAVQTLHKIAEENGYTFEALQSAKDVPNEFITRSDDKRLVRSADRGRW